MIAVHGIRVRHEIEVVRIEAGSSTALDGRLLPRQEFQLERRNDRLRDLVLQGENVLEGAVVAFGPDVAISRGFDKLGGNAYPVPDLPHAAFQYVADPKLPGDQPHVDRLALKRE